MRTFRKLAFTFLSAITLAAIPYGSATAAGSAVVSVEISSSSVTAGENVTLRFYVTPSGINVYSASTNVSLTNLSFLSYSPSSSPFTGYNAASSGGSVGSTSFSVTASYSGANAGSNGKTLIGVVTAQSSGSAGTGTVALSGADAYDINGDPMSASSQNDTVTINAPAAPTCPSGQTGTPPNCTSPSTPSGSTNSGNSSNSSSGGSSSSGSTNTTVNTVDNPNPDSTLNAGGETMSENDFSLAAAEAEAETVATTTKKTPASLVTKLVAGLMLVVLAAVAAKIILSRLARKRALNRHVAGSASPSIFSSEKKSDSVDVKDKPKDDHNSSNGPTIITPHQ